ncbi:glycosyltransferase family 39 protein [Paenibacillus chitinolyticus]|uniref:glycosyltransferase family 39 protein n=1 Tax=Paenibacillus chitinolyticus TaxID=79263 RepID=UPI00362CE236
MISNRRFRVDLPLVFILLLGVFLNTYNIWLDAYANTYYTTAVASMLQNFHNFFFGSLDSAGSVTVDKPPVTFWIQTVSAYIFGLHGWSVILPQALAGVGSILLIYLLVKPSFGTAAARISALVMACTPVAVAVSRTNNIDSMLVFTLLLGTWFLFRAIKRNSVFGLLGAFALIGFGFNMKMLQAYMILPAFVLFYLFAFKSTWKKKAGVLSGAIALMLVISVSWAVIVDSIPASERPYIGSSETNSVLELAFGYNGVSRLTGNQGGGPGGERGGMPGGERRGADGRTGDAVGTAPGTAGTDSGSAGTTSGQSAAGSAGDNGTLPGVGGATGGSAAVPDGADGGGMPGAPGGAGQGQPPGFGGGPGGGSGGMFGTGEKGPLRLFQSALSGQASWMIPFAALASVALLAGLRRNNFTRKHKESLFWLAWLLPGMAFFSVAGFFHHYYLIMLAPPIAALAGAGWSEMWSAYRSKSGWLSWLLPAAVAVTAAFQVFIMAPYNGTIGSGWTYGVGLTGAAAAVVLIVLKFRTTRFSYAAAVAGLLVLLIGPAYWAATPITYGLNSMIPQAGPSGGNDRGAMGQWPGGGMMPGGGSRDGAGFGPQNDDGANQVPDPGALEAGSGDDPDASTGVAGTGSGTDRSAGGWGAPGAMGGGMGGRSVNEALLAYMKAHIGSTTYLFATSDYNTAAPYIIDKGEKVVTLGGFSGNDPVYTTAQLEDMVKTGKLKYFLISEGGGGRGGNAELTQWLAQHGKKISSEEWQSGSTQTQTDTGAAAGMDGGRMGSMTLYEVTIEDGGDAS